MIQFQACNSAYQADTVEDASYNWVESSVALFDGNEQQKKEQLKLFRRSCQVVIDNFQIKLAQRGAHLIYLPPILVRLEQPPV